MAGAPPRGGAAGFGTRRAPSSSGGSCSTCGLLTTAGGGERVVGTTVPGVGSPWGRFVCLVDYPNSHLVLSHFFDVVA